MAVGRVRRGLGVRDGEVAPLHLIIFSFATSDEGGGIMSRNVILLI